MIFCRTVIGAAFIGVPEIWGPSKTVDGVSLKTKVC